MRPVAAMLVGGEIRLGSQPARDRRHLAQTDAGLVDVARYHEGDPRLVDQDRVASSTSANWKGRCTRAAGLRHRPSRNSSKPASLAVTYVTSHP